MFVSSVCVILVLTTSCSWHVEAQKFSYLIKGATSDPPDGVNHPCYRPCDGKPKTCVYYFHVLQLTAMSMECGKCPFNQTDCSAPGCIQAGGIVRPVVAVNRKIPGPSILVCENDNVQVQVKNMLGVQGLTIHWHGIHQIGTLQMDGSPYVTQKPIQPMETFSYQFKAHPHGTHMWHGHSSFQESDGLFGQLIVRRKESDQVMSLYDFDLPEHTAIIWHWYDKPTGDILPTVLHLNGGITGFGFLINGKGALQASNEGDQKENPVYTSRETFIIGPGKRYRFRFIYNSAIYCPIQISIDDHVMTVIASDTSLFEPVEVESFMMTSGERYDIVLQGKSDLTGCYWLRIRGFGDCDKPNHKIHGSAIVCYNGSTETPPVDLLQYENGYRGGKLLNPLDESTTDYSKNTLIKLTDLKLTEDEDIKDNFNSSNYSRAPDRVMYIQVHSRPYEQLIYPGPWHQFDNISFEFPQLTLAESSAQVATNQLCYKQNFSSQEFCMNDFCSCPYTIKVGLGELVELVFTDVTKDRHQDHPIHLHGYKFYVVAAGAVGQNITFEDIISQNQNGLIKKNLKTAIGKDSMSVPNKGYAILRFVASNPGFWMLHCHVTNHMELGMAMLLQVGEAEDFLKMNSGSVLSWNLNIILLFYTVTLILK